MQRIPGSQRPAGREGRSHGSIGRSSPDLTLCAAVWQEIWTSPVTQFSIGAFVGTRSRPFGDVSGVPGIPAGPGYAIVRPGAEAASWRVELIFQDLTPFKRRPLPSVAVLLSSTCTRYYGPLRLPDQPAATSGVALIRRGGSPVDH